MEKSPSIYNTIAENLVEFGLYAVIIGLFLSNALKSIGVVSICVSVLLHKNSLRNIRKLIDNKLYLALTALASLYILSIFHSSDYSTYLDLTKTKWLFFFFPLAIVNYTIPEKAIRNILLLAIGCALFQSFFGLYHLLTFDADALKKTYSTGNIIQTFKIHHVQISVLYSLLVLILTALIAKEKYSQKINIVLGIINLWLFITLHIFAVRSGIILTYIFLIGFSIVYLKKLNRNHLIFIAALMISGIGMFLKLDTIKNRIGYLKYDLYQYQQKSKDVMQYSDSRRLISINVGLNIIQENKLWGCGLGNIKNACAAIYKKTYPELDRKYYYLPHSQYIFFGACYGILIGVIVSFLFIYPCYYFLQHRKVVFFLMSFGLMLFAFWDAWLGTLFGNCLYILIVSFGIKNTLFERTAHQ